MLLRRAIAVGLVCLLAAAGSAAAPLDSEVVDPTPQTCDAHGVKYHKVHAKRLADAMFNKKDWHDATPVTVRQKLWWRWQIDCIYHPPTDQALRDYRNEQKRIFYRYHNTFGPYTPHGKYAIPAYIVYCESGTSGDWKAYNESSGAAGRYQILPMHHRVWPVNSWADKLQHTKIAYDLSGGGQYFDAWACA